MGSFGRSGMLSSPGVGPAGGGYVAEQMGTISFVFVVAPNHPLAKVKKVLGKAELHPHRAISVADSLLNNARQYGDLNHYTGLGRHIFQFNHPQLIEDLLLRDAFRHHRGIVMQRAKLVLGETITKPRLRPCRYRPGISRTPTPCA